MNIFILDTSPKLSAQYHCDKHVVKMILESAQMLCTAVRELGGEAPYRATHKNHPCVKWLRSSRGNADYLVELAKELNKEYKLRYKHSKDHKSWNVIEGLPLNLFPKGPLEPFVQCMPEEYKRANAVEAYRLYYKLDKAKNISLTYTNRQKPRFLD